VSLREVNLAAAEGHAELDCPRLPYGERGGGTLAGDWDAAMTDKKRLTVQKIPAILILYFKIADHWKTDVLSKIVPRRVVGGFAAVSGAASDRSPPSGQDDLPPARVRHARRTSLKSLYQDLWKGRYPAILTGRNRNRDLYYSSYIQTYLQRDVCDLTQVGNQRAYLKFIIACAARTGQLLNLSEIARDVGISVPTAKNWLSILQASFQIYLLPPYGTNVTKRLIKTPKLYFLDTGLCSYLTEWSSPGTLEAGAMSGAIFETHVFTEILKSYWHRGRQPACFYYRDRDGREIDLLLEQNGTLYPIEIKKTTLPKTDAIGAFSALGRLRPKVGAGAVICMAERMFPLDEKNTALPVSVL
jgi:uncharacterized protein